MMVHILSLYREEYPVYVILCIYNSMCVCICIVCIYTTECRAFFWECREEQKKRRKSVRHQGEQICSFLDFPCQSNILLLPSLVITCVSNIYCTVIHCITKHKIFDCYKHHRLISSSASLLEFLYKPPGSTPWT